MSRRSRTNLARFCYPKWQDLYNYSTFQYKVLFHSMLSDLRLYDPRRLSLKKYHFMIMFKLPRGLSGRAIPRPLDANVPSNILLNFIHITGIEAEISQICRTKCMVYHMSSVPPIPAMASISSSKLSSLPRLSWAFTAGAAVLVASFMSSSASNASKSSSGG